MIPPETVEPTNVGLWGAVGTIIIGAGAWVGTYLKDRRKRSAEDAALSVETSSSKAAETANELVERALKRLDGEIVKLRETIAQQADKIEQMRIKEQAMARSIMILEGHVDRLHEIMRSNNIEPPTRPVTGEMRIV